MFNAVNSLKSLIQRRLGVFLPLRLVPSPRRAVRNCSAQVICCGSVANEPQFTSFRLLFETACAASEHRWDFGDKSRRRMRRGRRERIQWWRWSECRQDVLSNERRRADSLAGLYVHAEDDVAAGSDTTKKKTTMKITASGAHVPRWRLATLEESSLLIVIAVSGLHQSVPRLRYSTPRAIAAPRSRRTVTGRLNNCSTRGCGYMGMNDVVSPSSLRHFIAATMHAMFLFQRTIGDRVSSVVVKHPQFLTFSACVPTLRMSVLQNPLYKVKFRTTFNISESNSSVYILKYAYTERLLLLLLLLLLRGLNTRYVIHSKWRIASVEESRVTAGRHESTFKPVLECISCYS